MSEKKKIVFNTTYAGAATIALMEDLIPRLKKTGYAVVRNDWDNYRGYDAALFMSPDSQVQVAKAAHPNIVTGIMDPKIPRERLAEVRGADFVVVTSLEQRNALLPYNSNPFIYYSLPDREIIPKQHSAKKTTIIGYHGNKEHLTCFMPHISRAIDRLAQERNIEFWAVYNIKSLGKWRWGVPRKALMRHIQWHPNIYKEELSKCDIGIANNSIPSNPTFAKHLTRYLVKRPNLGGYPYRVDDYVYRAKYSTNPGRIYEFALLHIPVIADYYPSASQVILDGKSGFIAYEEESWFWALKTLVDSPTLRNTMAKRLLETFQTEFSTEDTYNRFVSFFQNLLESK